MGDLGAFFGALGGQVQGIFHPGGHEPGKDEKSDGGLNSMKPRVPRLDAFIHADVLQARGLLPRNLRESEHVNSSSSSSAGLDPLVQAQVLVEDGDGSVHHAAGSRTATRVQTLRPVWDEELLLKDVVGADAVRFSVFDDAALGPADCLGYVDVPLPPRPQPLQTGARPSEELPYTQGWFALTATSEQWGKLWPVMSKCGRSERDPTPLGELHIRLTWGVGVPNPVLSHRPPLRRRLAHLLLRVHCVMEVPHTERPAVIARLEHQVGITPEQPLTSNRQWHDDDATFVFAVTEITADLVMSVVRAGNTMERSKTVGEVIIPVASLLGHKAQSRWVNILPPREPGEALLRPRRKPKQPLGRLCFTASLDLDNFSTPFAYLGEDVPARECPPGKDKSVTFSPERLHVSLGRVLDCVFGCMFAPLRTLLFLQAWLSPLLNVVLLGLLLLLTHPSVWNITLVCLPLWLVLFPFLNGLVSTLIQADEPVPLYKEDAEAFARAQVEAEQHEEHRLALFTEARDKLLAKLENHDPSLAQHRLAHKPIRLAMSHLKHVMGDMAHKAVEGADHLNIVKVLMAKSAALHAKVLVKASALESKIALLSWTDPRLTLLALLHAVVAGLLLSAVHGVVMYAAHTLTWSTCTLLTGLYCFMPFGVPITRSIIVSVDYSLSSLRSIGAIHPLLSGALLRTAPPPAELLHGAALQAAVDADARNFVEAKVAERMATLKERGQVHPRYLQLSRLLSGAYVHRLLARAPDVPRQAHIRMCAQAFC